MAYSKLPKIVSDYAVGIVSVNGAQANLQAIATGFAEEHGALGDDAVMMGRGRNRPAVPRHLQLGRHNTPLIPRDVVRVGAAVTPFASLASVGLLDAAVYIKSVTRIAAGQYFLAVDGLSQWWAHAVPTLTSTPAVPYWCACLSFYGSTPGQKSGVYVGCTYLAGGAFTALDFAFSLTLYGNP